MRILVLFPLFVLAGCNTEPSEATKDMAVQAAIEESVQKQLRDPSSAEFTEVRTLRIAGKAAGACGKVNSKNGFGGMSGPKRFIGGGNDVVVVEGDGQMAPEEFEKTWISMC